MNYIYLQKICLMYIDIDFLYYISTQIFMSINDYLNNDDMFQKKKDSSQMHLIQW